VITTRRDFLKTTSALAVSAALYPFLGNQAYAKDFFSAEERALALERKNDLLERVARVSKDIKYVEIDRREDYRALEFKSGINVGSIGNHHITVEYLMANYGDDKLNEKQLRKKRENSLEKDGKHPVVMVMPMLGKMKSLEFGFAESYAKAGIPALAVNLDEEGYGSRLQNAGNSISNAESFWHFTKALNEIFEQGLVDYMQVINLVSQIEELDEKRIGASGIGGLAGIFLPTLLGIVDKLKAGFGGMVGGDMGIILSQTVEGTIRDEREYLLEKIGKDEEWMATEINKEFKWDPLSYAHMINGPNTMMALAANDNIIPIETGEALLEAISGEDQEMMNRGHRLALLHTEPLKEASLEFFREKLA